MKKQSYFTKNALLIVTLFLFSSLTAQAENIFNSAANERFENAVAQKLTDRLRVELADQTVDVVIRHVENREVSQIEMNLDGSAVAVVKQDKTELPLEFNAKINLNSQSVEDISYQFVESPVDGSSEFAPSAAEGSLMKELMTQISKDYQTKNIVISIDGFETAKMTPDQTAYEGVGEVRIGDLQWSKIKFNVVLDSQNNKAAKISYEVQK